MSTKTKNIIAVVGVVLLIAAIAIMFLDYRNNTDDQLQKAKVMQQEQMTNIATLQNELKISDENAKNLSERISKIQNNQVQPNYTFTVTAPNVTVGAEDVTERIKNNDPTIPMQALEKSDRTDVVAVTKDMQTGEDLPPNEQKVDVYKINLEHPNRVKVGVTTTEERPYMTVGYECGKVEGLVHYNSSGKYGVSIMYNVLQW